MGSLNNLTHNVFTNKDNVTGAVNSMAQNIETATGGTFNPDGSWTATVSNTTANGYEYGSVNNIMSAVSQVAGNIGTAGDLTTAGQNGVATSNTVNANINAVNQAIGDVASLNKANGNIVETTNTVTGAVNDLDAAIGNRTYTAQNNVSSGETVTASVNKLDNAIGNRDYTSTRYVDSGSNLTSAVSSLDSNLSRVEDRVDSLDDKTNKMKHEMKSGFASLAAMSALVPNARSNSDTQLSIGTGYYRGTTGVAVGGFHYINDDILLNAGAAYGGNGASTFRSGVTVGF